MKKKKLKFPFNVKISQFQESDKEEMKEILEMKRIHERLAKKRLVERENRERERQKLIEKLLNSME